jgi:hypothetical protein
VGEGSKGTAASSGIGESDRLNGCEANDLGSRQEEDHGGAAGKVKQAEGGEEEINGLKKGFAANGARDSG